MYTEVSHQPEDTAFFSGNLVVAHILPRSLNDHIDTSEGKVSWIYSLDLSIFVHPKT
jgi:hypothetical protein